MRGGRNKFGPMYKRDRARKLQVIRERQMSTSRASVGGTNSPLNNSTSSNGGAGHGSSSAAGMYTDMGYSPSGGVYAAAAAAAAAAVGPGGVKHEIQIPQVSSLTSSPDSSPSPLAVPGSLYPGQSISSFL